MLRTISVFCAFCVGRTGRSIIVFIIIIRYFYIRYDLFSFSTYLYDITMYRKIKIHDMQHIISGYFGEMTDILMQRTIDVIGSIPTLVVVTLLMIVLKPGIGSIIFALMLSGWIEMSRIARAEVLKVKELEYIQAAKTIGAGHMHIIFREMVPNIAGKLVTQIMLSIPEAVFLEAFLSFVGLGMPAGTCSLGTLLTDGFQNILLHPYKLLPAALIMILLMVSCHLVAEGLKKAM